MFVLLHLLLSCLKSTLLYENVVLIKKIRYFLSLDFISALSSYLLVYQ